MQTRTTVLATVLAAAGVLGVTGTAVAKPVPASTPPTFRQLDADRNGSLSLPELLTAGKRQGVSPTATRRVFKQLDANRDGRITRGELLRMLRTP